MLSVVHCATCVQVANCSAEAAAPYAACLHVGMLSDRAQQVVFMDSFMVAPHTECWHADSHAQPHSVSASSSSHTTSSSHSLDSGPILDSSLTHNSETMQDNVRFIPPMTRNRSNPVPWLPLLQRSLYNCWLPLLLFPDQVTVVYPAFIANLGAQDGSFMLVVDELQFCGVDAGLTGLLLVKDVLYMERGEWAHVVSHAIGNCTLSGSNLVGKIVPQAMDASMGTMEAQLGASVPRPVVDTEQYAATPRLGKDAVLRLQYMELANLSRGGSELRAELQCPSMVPCNYRGVHLEDGLYANMTLPL